MKNQKLMPLIVSLLLLAGCATPISPEQIAHADYGPPPPKNYQALIKQDFATILIDPTSPLYTFSKPSKGYFKESAMGTTQMFGWRVCGTVNSKNRMGGYSGAAPFIVLFRDGKIAQKYIGESDAAREGLFINPAIAEACNR